MAGNTPQKEITDRKKCIAIVKWLTSIIENYDKKIEMARSSNRCAASNVADKSPFSVGDKDVESIENFYYDLERYHMTKREIDLYTEIITMMSMQRQNLMCKFNFSDKEVE